MLGIPAVNDTKWRMNEFSKERQVEFRNDTPHIGMSGKVLALCDDFRDKPGANIRHPFILIPLSYSLQIGQRRFRKTDTCRIHGLFQSQL